MSSARQKLMEEIDKKVQKRKNAKDTIDFSKSVEGIIFDFFKNMDDISAMGKGWHDSANLCRDALTSMTGRLKSIDNGCRVSVSYVHADEDAPLDYTVDDRPQSVTVHWTGNHQIKNGGVEMTTVDVSQMLFF
jgi:hypothetical protein